MNDITYRVRTPNTERLFSNLDAALSYWAAKQPLLPVTVEKGRYETVNGRTVWVKA